ncbi:MAG: amidohydrolase [Deltaproteobacteria bacterium]|nr:amidohydrolase [Deltaproteobacteria bacterium]
MSQVKSVDTLFPLLLKEWKQSWVQATNSPGELKCKVELAWGDGYENGEALIKAMDAANVDVALATDLLAWSYRRQARFAMDLTDHITELSKKYPGRIYGLADYDPTDIRAGLKKVEEDVTKRGFKGVYLHIYGYDIGLDHRKMYPLYAMCEGLGVAVSMQVGHVLEAMPSEHGRPIQLDRIACDFPQLKLIGTHTGYPWTDEMIAVTTKWPNVYLSVSAWLPKYFSPTLVSYLKSRAGREKVLFGSNGLSWDRYNQQFAEMGLDEDTAKKVMRDNALKVFGINQ